MSPTKIVTKVGHLQWFVVIVIKNIGGGRKQEVKTSFSINVQNSIVNTIEIDGIESLNTM